MKTCSSGLLSQSELEHVKGCVSVSYEGEMPMQTVPSGVNYKHHDLSTRLMSLDSLKAPHTHNVNSVAVRRREVREFTQG